ncbi:MAG: putative small lipoprotein YifL [Polaribacter sp.]|jgi:predicted small lipoprotein YifL
MKTRIAALLTILCLGLLTGCGNSGDLYLDEDTAETFTTDSQFREH